MDGEMPLRKKERRELRKQEKMHARQAQTQRKLFFRFGAGAIVVGILGVGAWFVIQTAITPLPGRKVPDQGRQHVAPGAPHEPYNSNPPTSGPHSPEHANWGVHQTTIPPEYQVHNLEHGGVIVHYKCPAPPEPLATSSAEPTTPAARLTLSGATVSTTPSSPSSTPPSLATESASQEEIVCAFMTSQLESLVHKYPAKVILMPNPDIESTIALTAWTRIDTFDILDLDRVKRFIDAYRNRGPEKVPDDMPSVHFD